MRMIKSAANSCYIRGDSVGALHLYWKAILHSLFIWLDDRDLPYSSTETALLQFFRANNDNNYPTLMMELYHVSILCEYYESDLNQESIEKFVMQAREVLVFFDINSLDQDDAGAVYIKEIEDYIEDCRWSLESHFFAAQKYEKRQSYWIKYPLVFVSALMLFMAQSSSSDVVAFIDSNVPFSVFLPEILALILALLSGFNAASSMDQKAEKHRSAANKYISLKRDASLLKVDIKRTNMNKFDDAVIIEKLLGIKNSLNNIAQDAPQIPRFAYMYAKKVILEEKGSWDYIKIICIFYVEKLIWILTFGKKPEINDR